MHLYKHIVTLFAIIILSSISVLGFPNGAPVDTCVKPRANQPYHGEARSQPSNTNPYQILASTSQYTPGSQITVSIVDSSFQGFFLQARDVNTNAWIGNWMQTSNINTHHECSAVTHADPHDKEQATFIWIAPPNARGRVYFTGTVLKNYSTFWSDITSRVVQ